MNYLQSFVIALVEGLTEFLPISSTAHMKIANPILGIASDPFTDMFEVVIQLAAILSVVTVYWKKFLDFKSFSFYIKLGIAVVPALVFGALLKKHIDAMLGNLNIIACVMLAGGVLLLFIDKLFPNPTVKEETAITNKNALVIGCFQVLSILFPGLSRSAATIIGGMSQKLSRGLAAEFSFFLAVPTMFAASVKSLLDVYKESPETLKSTSNLGTLGLGGLVAYIIALLTIRFFVGFVQTNGFKVFGWYRIALGALVLGLVFSGTIPNPH